MSTSHLVVIAVAAIGLSAAGCSSAYSGSGFLKKCPNSLASASGCDTVIAHTQGGTCDSYCQDRGLKCVAAQDNLPGYDNCDPDPSHAGGCSATRNDQLCKCSAHCTSGHVKMCPGSFPTDEAATGCETALALTSGGNCNTWCENQGLQCVRAADNQNGWTNCAVDTSHSQGCAVNRNDQLCLCGPKPHFCVVSGSSMVGVYNQLSEAKNKLNTITSGSRMICEMNNGKAKADPHTVGGENQGGGSAAGFNKYWNNWNDIHRMNGICDDSSTCTSGQAVASTSASLFQNLVTFRELVDMLF